MQSLTRTFTVNGKTYQCDEETYQVAHTAMVRREGDIMGAVIQIAIKRGKAVEFDYMTMPCPRCDGQVNKHLGPVEQAGVKYNVEPYLACAGCGFCTLPKNLATST